MDFYTPENPITKLLVALALGAFLGVRREIKALESKKDRSFMGFRTMALLSTLGALSTLFPALPYLPVVLFGAVIVLVGIAYANGSFNMGRIGITTEISAIFTYWIGVLVGMNEPVLAIIITIILAFLNAFRDYLRGFVSTLNEHEWIGALQLLAISGAVLPFLPMEAIDPWGVLVPFKVWLLVILISGLGLLGYFLTKYFGLRGGIPLMAVFGSIVSSTAVTTALADQAKRTKLTLIFAVGIFIALATMQFRVMIEILALGTLDIIKAVVPMAAVMAVVSIGVAGAYFWIMQHRFSLFETKPKIELESPFRLMPALQFGAIFVLVLFALAFGHRYFGNSGVYVAAVFSGIIDVDAIVLSILESLRNNEVDVLVARNAIGIALIINTIIKIGFVAILGTLPLVRRVAVGVIPPALVGIAILLLT